MPQAEQESAALQSIRSDDAETQWRHFVKNMEAWNRIVMNLVSVHAWRIVGCTHSSELTGSTL